MKNNPLPLLILIFGTQTITAQNTNLDYKSAIKISNQTTFEEQSESRRLNETSSYRHTKRTLQMLHPTVAFQWKSKKNNFHEIELTSLTIGKIGNKTAITYDSINNDQKTSDNELATTSISARYEYIMNFNKSKESKFVPSIGFGLNPYYSQNSYSPKTSSSSPNSEIRVGMRAFITPRITYFVSSKLFIDLNIPLNIFDLAYFKDEFDNPNFPVQQKTVSSFDYDQIPNLFCGRLGVGLKL